MAIPTHQVKELRERTGAGILDAKNALESTGGDMEQAIQILREKGLAAAAKKATREAREGHVLAYIHGNPGRVGVLVEVNCETDFVARTDDFRALVHNVAMQIAAANPQWVTDADVPADVMAHERATFEAQLANDEANAKKPPQILAKIVDGKINKWLDESVLLRQPFIRDNDLTVSALVTNAIAELGENIVVRRFTRYELGGEA